MLLSRHRKWSFSLSEVTRKVCTLRLANQHEPTSSLNEENIKEFSCQTYISSRVYNNIESTQDELNYPVAYSIVVHANFGQVERLIRAIWRPQEWSSTRLATVTFRIRYAAYVMSHMICLKSYHVIK